MAASRSRRTRAVDPAVVRRDAELRALVEQHPGDGAALMVYADWLEEQGDTSRATFLRAMQQLRGLRVGHPRLLARGRALFELGKTLPRDWVDAVTHPRLAGTAWAGSDDDGPLVWRFLASGFINYTDPSGTYENGRWEQVGNTVAMETNAHYADYFGVIVGDMIRGNARNIVEHTWRWKVTRTEDPAIATVPAHVDRTIHDGYARARTAPPKPQPRPKAKRKPLARRTPLARKARLGAARRT